MNCNKRIGFNTASYSLEGDKAICSNCYDKIESFSVIKKYSSMEEFSQTKKIIQQEMNKNNFNQESMDYINKYLLCFKLYYY